MTGGKPSAVETLRRILEPLGLWNVDGITRRARATMCRDCGLVTMRGLDAQDVAMPAVCDPAALNRLGEVAALFAGLRTYSLTWQAGRYVIDLREPERIISAPAGSRANSDVLAEHQCGRDAPAEMQAASNLSPAPSAPLPKGAANANAIPF